MKVLFLVAVLFLAKAYAGVINGKCEYQRFQKCMDGFAKDIGLPSDPMDPSAIDKQIQKLLSQGEQGKRQVCNAGDNVQKCLGDEYNDCMSVEYLMSLGISQKDAEHIIGESNQLQEMCSRLPLKANQCELDRLIQCASTFAYQLGLSGLPLSPKQLDDTIQNLLSKGPAGKKQVCDADVNLQLCLANEYSSCFTVDYLKSIGLSASDAQGFVDEAKKLQGMCKSASNAECDSSRYFKCTKDFAHALGMHDFPYYSDVLKGTIQRLLDQGPQGKKQVCDADNALKTCFGDQYKSCISFDYFSSIVDEYDAHNYVDIFNSLEQTCKSTLKSNAQCDVAHLIQCSSTFAYQLGLPNTPLSPKQWSAAIQKLFDQGDKQKVCNAFDGFQKCLADEYKSCFTVDYLKSIGISAADAQAYVDEANKLQQTCKSASNAQCDITRFSQCTDTFAKALGLPNMPTDAQKLIDQISHLIDDGKKAQVCSADKALIQCLGDQYDSCITIDFLKSIGESDIDAQKFVGEAIELKRMCA